MAGGRYALSQMTPERVALLTSKVPEIAGLSEPERAALIGKVLKNQWPGLAGALIGMAFFMVALWLFAVVLTHATEGSFVPGIGPILFILLLFPVLEIARWIGTAIQASMLRGAVRKMNG